MRSKVAYVVITFFLICNASASAFAADPDSGSNDTVLWDQWHHRVAELVFQRFSTMANASFKDGKPMRACASYAVSKGGHIINAHISQRSPNAEFNTVIIAAINSLNGNSALQFPSSSKKNSVEKTAEFTMNSGLRGDFGPHPSVMQNRYERKELAE